jgi:hypothetical protein
VDFQNVPLRKGERRRRIRFVDAYAEILQRITEKFHWDLIAIEKTLQAAGNGDVIVAD